MAMIQFEHKMKINIPFFIKRFTSIQFSDNIYLRNNSEY